MKFIQWKPLVLIATTAIFLVGCTDKEEQAKGSADATQGIDFNALYEMDDDTILLEVNGHKMTVADAKRDTFERGLIHSISQFVDTEMLATEYEISDDAVAKEKDTRKTENATAQIAQPLDDATIRYDLAFDKFVANEVKVTDKDLKATFQKYYNADGRTFEEMKPILIEQVPHILGNELIYKKQDELRKNAKVEFFDASLEQNLNHMFNSSNEEVTPINKTKP